MAQPIDSTTPTTAPHSPTHTAARIVVATDPPIPIIYPLYKHKHPGDPIPSPDLTAVPTPSPDLTVVPTPSPDLTAVPIQAPPGTWTYYHPPPVTSTSAPSSSKESGTSKSIVGPVVGGAVGGLFLVFLVALLVVQKRKKCKEARKRRLDFLEGRNPVGLFTFGGITFSDIGTAAIANDGGGGIDGSGAVPAAGHRPVPHKAFSYPPHHQQQQEQNQHESEDQDEEQYDPYFAHHQRQWRLQLQAAREYYAAQLLQQKQIQGYYSEDQFYQHHQSQHFTPAASVSVRRSYDGSLSPVMTQITAQSPYPEYAYPYPQRPPLSATMGLRRHSAPWMMSPFQHQYQQSLAGIPEIERRASSFDEGSHNTTIDSSPTGSSHIIAENHVEIPMQT